MNIRIIIKNIWAAYRAIRSSFFVFVISTGAKRNGEISSFIQLEISPLRSEKSLASVEMTKFSKNKKGYLLLSGPQVLTEASVPQVPILLMAVSK